MTPTAKSGARARRLGLGFVLLVLFLPRLLLRLLMLLCKRRLLDGCGLVSGL